MAPLRRSSCPLAAAHLAALFAGLAFSHAPAAAAQGPALTQDLYLKASNTDIEDRFGSSIAAFGDLLVVGAPDEDGSFPGVNPPDNDNALPDSGAAYVFRFEGGQWVQEAYIKASNPDAGDRFGVSVAIGDDVLVVGAPLEDSGGSDPLLNDRPDSGAAYVFRFTQAGGWAQTDFLKAAVVDAGDGFAESLAIDGGVLIVGAPGEDGVTSDPGNNGAGAAGAAYVFGDNGGTSFTQQAFLKSTNPDSGDEFGSAVDVFIDEAGTAFVVVGIPFEDSASVGVGGDASNNSGSNSGAAFLFSNSGSGYSVDAFLKGLNTGPGDNFGGSVAIGDARIVVGALNEDSSVGGVNPSNPDDSLGSAGAAYVFDFGPGGANQISFLKSSNPGPLDRFGFRVAYADGRVLVSAPNEASNSQGINGNQSSNGAGFSGAAYLFEQGPFVNLQQTAYIKASNTQSNDSFAASVAITDRWVFSGATREDSSGTGTMAPQFSNGAKDSGAAYIFRLGDGPFLNYCFAASNSTGSPATISGTGSGLIADNDVVLQVSSLPANVFGFYFVGTTRAFVVGPGGSLGNLCVGGGQLGRYTGPGQVQNSGSSGSFSLAIDATTIPSSIGPIPTLPGDEFQFQAWYRDTVFGMPVSNFSNGLTVLFR